MNKIWSALAFIGLAAISSAQTVIYEPVKTIGDQNISLQGWGSGTIGQTDETAYQGTLSIRVSSRNFFQGGIMNFGTPQNLSQLFGDNANMLRITYLVPDANTTFGGKGGNGPGMPGAPGGGKGSGPVGPGRQQGGPGGGVGLPGGGGKGLSAGGKQGGAPGGGQGIGLPGNKGGLGGQSNTTDTQPPLSMIRVIVTTTDGKKSEAYIPLTTSTSEPGWKQVAIPLAAITGFDKTNKDVKEMAFSGDSTATFYLGDIRVINDTTPVSGEANIDRTNMALGDEATLTAYGYAGASVLTYSWDFDSDGKTDATGQYVKHKFRTPGDFTISLTVADKYGLKKPYTTQLKVHVNP